MFFNVNIHAEFGNSQNYRTKYVLSKLILPKKLPNEPNVPDLLWMVIVCHLQMPSKENLIHLVCLFGSLFGKIQLRFKVIVHRSDIVSLCILQLGVFIKSRSTTEWSLLTKLPGPKIPISLC